MSTVWDALANSQAFWRALYTEATEWWTPVAEIRLRFCVASVHLELSIAGAESRLVLDDGDRHLLGHVDAHFASDVFRWEELQIVSDALAHDVQPQWAIDLLLMPYVAPVHLARLRDALSASSLFRASEVEAIVEAKRPAATRDVRWTLEPSVACWVPTGDVRGRRRLGGGFPFDAWNRFLSAAEARS